MDHRGDADLNLRHAEFGVMGRDPEVAGGGGFEAAAEAPAGPPRDHRRRKRPYRLAEIPEAGNECLGRGLIESGHFLDVGAADHALLALPGDHENAKLPFRGEGLQSFANGVDDGRPQDVEGTGVADRQAYDAARVAVDAAVRI